MGGKDSGSSGLASYGTDIMNRKANDTQDEYMAQVEAMMGGMMEAMAASMAALQSQQPELPSMPQSESTPSIDWKEKMDQLQNKMRADYTTETERKKGRLDTIHTSPLLLEEDISTTDTSKLGSGTLVTK